MIEITSIENIISKQSLLLDEANYKLDKINTMYNFMYSGEFTKEDLIDNKFFNGKILSQITIPFGLYMITISPIIVFKLNLPEWFLGLLSLIFIIPWGIVASAFSIAAIIYFFCIIIGKKRFFSSMMWLFGSLAHVTLGTEEIGFFAISLIIFLTLLSTIFLLYNNYKTDYQNSISNYNSNCSIINKEISHDRQNISNQLIERFISKNNMIDINQLIDSGFRFLSTQEMVEILQNLITKGNIESIRANNNLTIYKNKKLSKTNITTTYLEID